MTLRTLGAVVVTALAVSAVPAISATAEASHHGGHSRVSVSLPVELVEGDAFKITVKVGRTDGAKQVQLLQQVTVTGGKTIWQLVGKAKARKKKSYAFLATGGEDDTMRFKAKVLYDQGPAANSEVATTAVWHWTALNKFAPYAHTSGTNDSGIASFLLSGLAYTGWYTTGQLRTWESKFTPGRHCKALRGTAGVTDASADGSSAVVKVSADDVPVFSTLPLSPGAPQPFTIPLALPFRIGISAQNTSALGILAYPAVAAPELLCTGL